MTTASTTLVVGSASLSVLGQVTGPHRSATVLHSGRSAVYVAVDGTCLAVLAAPAVQVPCGVRTSLPALPDVRPGDEAVVGGGAVRLLGLEVVVTDIVDTAVPALSSAAVASAAEQLARLATPYVHATRGALPAAALADLAAGRPDAVPALLGLGPGLTPLGDDVLCGWLAAAVAAGHPALGDVRDAVLVRATTRTTTLSAALLGCAARGEAVPEFRALLGAAAERDPSMVQQSVRRLLAVGGTSGAGLLLGAVLAMEGVR